MGHHGSHGNPHDLAGYLAKLEDPARAEWQRPDEVVEALALLPGQTVADLGTGPAWFALRLARAVGEAGHVFAVDVEPQMLALARDRIAASGLRNLSPILALPDDPLLPAASCDLLLIANTFHHFRDGAGYLRAAARALKPDGRLVNIDFDQREPLVGPPMGQRVTRDRFLAQADAAGLTLASEPTFLPYQYFLILEKK
ncbi:MAG: methyltransferase domain-containing protein [Myxococcales bacterium]|nr:methyltransferase domain-containing protein [Myxococcales bacterium]